MADYYSILVKAIEALPSKTGEARRSVYEKARNALLAQLKAMDPPLSVTQITQQRLSLEAAVRRVEQEAAMKNLAQASRSPELPPAPSPTKSRTNAKALDELRQELDKLAEGLPPARPPQPSQLRRPPPPPSPLPTRPALRVGARSKVFISYRREDARYPARDIYKILTEVLSAENVFMDIDSIPPGANFVSILEHWVEQCDVLLALIGSRWTTVTDSKTDKPRLHNERDYVRIELRKALARNIPVVPVILDNAPFPDESDLPDDLKELCVRQAEFVNCQSIEADARRLIKKLGITRSTG